MSKIYRIRHFGFNIVKEDWYKTLNFYEYLGFEKIYEEEEKWNHLDGKVLIVKMAPPDDCATQLEFIQVKHKNNETIFNDHYHISLEIDDENTNLKKLVKKLRKEFDIEIEVRPKRSGNYRVAFVRDPSYNLVELVEEVF